MFGGKLTDSSSVPHKSYVYGGQTGTTVCTVAFKKTASSGANGVGSVEGSDAELEENPLYICIDVGFHARVDEPADKQCGGTKTDVAISDRDGTVSISITFG
jgi:hypothetical protein